MLAVLHLTSGKNEGNNLLGRKHPEQKAKGIYSEAVTEEGRPHEIQGRQGEVAAGRDHVRHVQRLHRSSQRG